jgi:hypothetical protein
MRKILAMACLVLLTGAGAAAPVRSAPKPDKQQELVRTVVALAEEMVKNASDMHPERNARLIPDTDKVVYVSFGHPMTGKQYVPVLQRTYAKRRSQDLRWDKWEVTPIGDHAAVFTGWATMREESHAGEKKATRLIFTEVFDKTDAGWKRIIAQKAVLSAGD